MDNKRLRQKKQSNQIVKALILTSFTTQCFTTHASTDKKYGLHKPFNTVNHNAKTREGNDYIDTVLTKNKSGYDKTDQIQK